MNFSSTLSIFVTLAVCSCQKAQTPGATLPQRNAIDRAYCTNDVNAAERSLRDYLRQLDLSESNHVKGIDFDMARALAHGRLFLIYRHVGDTNEVQAEYQKSLAGFKTVAAKSGAPFEQASPDALAGKLDRIDSYLNVQWKTNNLTKH